MPLDEDGRPLWNSAVDPTVIEFVRNGDNYAVVRVEDDDNLDYLLGHENVVEFDDDGYVERLEAPRGAAWDDGRSFESRPHGREVFDVSERPVSDERVVERRVDPADLPQWFDGMPGGRPTTEAFRIINEVTAEGGSVPLSRVGYWMFPDDGLAVCDSFGVNARYTDDKRVFRACVRFAHNDYDEFEVSETVMYSDRENKLGWINLEYERVKNCPVNDGAAWYRRVRE